MFSSTLSYATATLLLSPIFVLGASKDDSYTPYPYDRDTSSPDGADQFKQDMEVSARLSGALINAALQPQRKGAEHLPKGNMGDFDVPAKVPVCPPRSPLQGPPTLPGHPQESNCEGKMWLLWCRVVVSFCKCYTTSSTYSHRSP